MPRDQVTGARPDRRGDTTKGSAQRGDTTKGSAQRGDTTKGSAQREDTTKGSAQRGDTTKGSAQRYRDAAEFTLDQLDWCISYLRSIRRNELARTLSRNRDAIRRRLRAAGR